MTIKITPNDRSNPPEKLADAELHFSDGPLEGLKLIGFSVWERPRGGGGRNVTFPARQYNPLHNDLDAYALAYGIATLMTNLFGRGKEPFWQQASTNLVKFVILLHQVLDDYVTLFQVYEHVINADKLRARIAEGERRFGAHNRRILTDKREHLFGDLLYAWPWRDADDGVHIWTHWAKDVEDSLVAAKVPFQIVSSKNDEREIEKAAQFDAVKRWFEDDWMRIEPKLRTSIVEGVSVFLSLFDDNPRVKHTFCPPKDVYDAASNADGRHGVALPPLADLIEQGKIIALNFPIAMNPGLARAFRSCLNELVSVLEWQRNAFIVNRACVRSPGLGPLVRCPHEGPDAGHRPIA